MSVTGEPFRAFSPLAGSVLMTTPAGMSSENSSTTSTPSSSGAKITVASSTVNELTGGTTS